MQKRQYSILVNAVLRAYGAINTETKENKYFKSQGCELYICYSWKKRIVCKFPT